MVASSINAKTVVVPSVASTDAPCTGLSVMYTPDGAFDEYVFFPKSPDLVRAVIRWKARAEGEGRGWGGVPAWTDCMQAWAD
eukprot:354691-Chlamydomonas_euryale.AAC.15